MEVRNSNFAAFIDLFTANTYIMVIMSEPTIRNIKKKQIIYLIFNLQNLQLSLLILDWLDLILKSLYRTALINQVLLSIDRIID